MEVFAPLFPTGIESARISTIYSIEGDEVSTEQLLLDIETEKVVLEVTSPGKATIKELNVSVGDVVESQQLLMILDDFQIEESSDSELNTEPEEVSESETEKQGRHNFVYILLFILIGMAVVIGVNGS